MIVGMHWIDWDSVKLNRRPSVLADKIIKATAAHYGHSVEQMLRSARWSVVEHRQIAMYLCRELTDLSLVTIGQAFGRDHTTPSFAHKKIRGLVERGRLDLDELMSALRQEVPA